MMQARRGLALFIGAVLLTVLSGCNHFAGKDSEKLGNVSLWLILAGGGGVMAILGIAAALNASKDDENKTIVGMILVVIGVLLAVLGVA